MSLSITALDRRDLNVIFARLFQLAGFTYGITQAGANLGEIVAAGLSDLSSLASTEHNYGASLVGIEDAGGLITATTVEGALAELATNLASGVAGAVTTANLASTAAGKGASLVGVRDAGGLLAAATVEDALAEIMTATNAAAAVAAAANNRKEFSEFYAVLSASNTYDMLSGNSLLLRVRMLRPGSITGIKVDEYTAVVAGQATFAVTVNGVASGAQLVQTANNNARATFAAGTYPVVAGDVLSLEYTTNAGYLPNNNGCSGTIEITET